MRNMFPVGGQFALCKFCRCEDTLLLYSEFAHPILQRCALHPETGCGTVVPADDAAAML